LGGEARLRRPPDVVGMAGLRIGGRFQVRVSSAMAFFALVSSMRLLLSAAAAMRAAVAALVSARRSPLA